MYEEEQMNKVVAVAMSGGVDSSLTAKLLMEQGYDVFGITMQLWVNGLGDDKPSPAVIDAKKMCDYLGIKHYVLNAREQFYNDVVQYFVSEYAGGRTPNPCVFCDKHIKFGLLLDKALSLGATHMVTGHYAQVRYNEDTKLYELHKGMDSAKDQSYVLYTLNQKILSHLMFPLGGQKKTVTRQMAADRGLPVATKPDSEDICFLPDNDYKTFMQKQLGKNIKPGNIVHENGQILGWHNGLFNYTIGQRKGLGIAYPYPLYVIRLDGQKNEVIVGPNDSLFTKKLICKSYNFLSGQIPKRLETTGKIRYAAQPADCLATILDDGTMEVVFKEPQRAITQGQSVVFYDGTQVLGGGVIDSVC